MQINTAECVGLEGSMSKIKINFDHDGQTYKGIIWSENDGRDAEIDHDTFNHELPEDLAMDFFEMIFEEKNIHIYEAALAEGYKKWEEANT